MKGSVAPRRNRSRAPPSGSAWSAFAGFTLVLAFLATTAGPAAAHSGEPDPVKGTVTLAPGDAALEPIPYFDARDKLYYEWTVVDGNAAAFTGLLTWVDDAGGRHDAATLTGANGEGKLDATGDLARAELTFANQGDAPITVQFSTLASAPFWRTPSLYLPAMLPLFLLAFAMGFGWWWDRRAKRIDSGTAPRVRAAVSNETKE